MKGSDSVKRQVQFGLIGAASILSLTICASSLFAANSQNLQMDQQAPRSAAREGTIQLAQAGGDKPVSFADNQATRGAKLYKEVCTDCHGDHLQGGLIGGPPLRGSAFDKKFASGAPVSALFGFVSGMMPPDAPGQFSPAEYADVIAFILRENGFQSGAPLPVNSDAQDKLIVEK